MNEYWFMFEGDMTKDEEYWFGSEMSRYELACFMVPQNIVQCKTKQQQKQ